MDIRSLPTRNAIIEQNFPQQQFAQTKKEELFHGQSITSVQCVTYDKSHSEEDLRSRNQVISNEYETFKGDSTSNITRSSSFRRAKSLDGGGSAYRNSPVMFSACSKNDDSYNSGGEIGQVKCYSHNDVLMSISKQRQFDSPNQSAPYSRMSAESGE